MNNNATPTKQNSLQHGFTIVELLIVIVVIAILAAISIVAYNGISTQAATTVLKSDLANAARQLELDKVESGQYQGTDGATTDGNPLKRSDGTTFQYTRTGDSYCLTATSNRSGVPAFHISNTNPSPQEGVCPGHTSPVAGNDNSGGELSWENADSSIGTSWGIVSASNSGQKVAVFRGDFYGSIYRSTDYGSTFQEITYPAGQNSNSCLGMSYSPNGATLVILCSSHLAPFYSLYSSSNDGATWGALSWNAPNLAWGVMNIELLNDSLSHIAASSRIGEGCANPDVVVSTNSGNTWSTPYSGDGPYACSQGVTLWRVAGANTVVSECFESSNFGTSWSTSTQYANGGGCARAANAGGDMIFWDGKMRYAGSQTVVDRNSALTGSIADAAISVNGNYAYVLTSNGLFRGTR